ncbi:MAG: M16 family metallopeptidase [Bryobacteraceae bacterium]
MKTLIAVIRAASTAALLAVTAVAADKSPSLPRDLPPYGDLKPVAAPRVTQVKLDNGLVVWLVPSSGFPKIAFSIAIRGGYTADSKDRPGMADLIAAAVTQGTKGRSARQLAEELQGDGGDLEAEATSDAILLNTSVLSSKAEPAVQLLADVMQNAAFADDEVTIAKRNVASRLQAREGESRFLGTRALHRALFGDHPYAVIAPTQDSIAKTTASDLRSEYSRRFRPDAAVFVAVGDFDEAKLSSAIRTDFGSWKAAGTGGVADTGRPKTSTSRVVVYVPRANSVQTAFFMGTLAPDRADPDYAATRVANAIYGGMFGSRLISNIREDKGYTYSPFSRLAPYAQAGVLTTSADVRNTVTGASFNEITYELNRIATTSPEQRELDRAKRYLIGSQAVRLQSREAVARSLANLWVDSLPPEELGLESQKVEQITAKDVEAAGRRYFSAYRMTIVAVGEEKVIKDELSPFGLEFEKSQ